MYSSVSRFPESDQESFSGFGRSYSGATKDGVANGIQEHFVRNPIRLLAAMKIVHIEGEEHLESALRKGKRVIAFGAHS
jgi:lauroyl/myristoyl acyltransferase